MLLWRWCLNWLDVVNVGLGFCRYMIVRIFGRDSNFMFFVLALGCWRCACGFDAVGRFRRVGRGRRGRVVVRMMGGLGLGCVLRR